MQHAAGNIFVDRSGITRHSDHLVINLLVGIFVIFQVIFRPAAYFECLMICLYQTRPLVRDPSASLEDGQMSYHDR